MDKPKIFVFAEPSDFWTPRAAAVALAEDGEILASHISANEGFVEQDLGVTSKQKHNRYGAKYPDGFEVEFVMGANVHAHGELQQAIAKNKESAEAFCER